MIEVLRTNDAVRLSWAEALLRGAGLEPVVLDVYASAVEGSISAIPRRLAVPEGDADQARRLLQEAGAFDL